MSYFERLLLLPVGSYEYHGRHLPADTDTRIAAEVTRAAAGQLRGCAFTAVELLPPLAYGLSREHHGLPTTGYVSHLAYWTFMTDLLDSLASPRTLMIVVNGHGGNVHTLSALEADFNYRHSDCKLFAPALYPKAIQQLCSEMFGEFDPHAGSVEASLIAHYDGRPRQEWDITPPALLRGTFRFRTTIELNPDAIIKRLPKMIVDPAKGAALHDALLAALVESVLSLAVELGDALSRKDEK